ncbi:MAG TPA: GDYXXLXY domain-containing protein [Lacunisphaera sp.]
MKPKLALAVAALQVLVLGFMAGQREWIMRTGTPLTLRTAPIDPNDPMRGAYVRLNYEISNIPAEFCRGETAQWIKPSDDIWRSSRLRDRVVYASLRINEHGLTELVALREVPPASGPFLRGRVVSANQNNIQVRYGIEALFMAKEAAVRMESMAIKEKAGAPLAVQVMVGSSGTAVLKNHAWEPLGLTLVLHRPAPAESSEANRFRPQQPINALTATLHNYGDKDFAIVDLPGGRSFRLVSNLLVNYGRYVPAPPSGAVAPPPQAAHVIVLKPGASHAIQIDLSRPDWWIRDTSKADAKATPLSEVQDWTASFRLEYIPPAAEVVRGLPHADLVRHVPLRSRAFSAMQGVD